MEVLFLFASSTINTTIKSMSNLSPLVIQNKIGFSKNG